MTTTTRQRLLPYIAALETATGCQAGEPQLQAALAASLGGHVIVTPIADALLVAALAATIAAADGAVHLVTATDDEAARLSPAFQTLGLGQIRCASAQTFIFRHLNGTGETPTFAVIARADESLLREAKTPYIVATPPTDGASLVPVPKEIHSEADRVFQRDRDYILRDGEIVVRDSETGELFPGRRFSGGLHTALQEREGLSIQPDGDIVAQTTAADYFRLYPELTGIAPTADTRYQSYYNLSHAT